MGFFEGFLRPKKVQEAVLNADQEKLSAMGKKGAERAADHKDLQREKASMQEVEAALERAKVYRLNEDGDVLPPDSGAGQPA